MQYANFHVRILTPENIANDLMPTLFLQSSDECGNANFLADLGTSMWWPERKFPGSLNFEVPLFGWHHDTGLPGSGRQTNGKRETRGLPDRSLVPGI